MKKFFMPVFLLLNIVTISFGQETEKAKQPLSRNEYLAKSKSQKITGFILLGAGIASIIIVAPGNASFGTTSTFAVIGGLAIAGSIPLFIAAGKNKRKAKNASASVIAEKEMGSHYVYHKPILFPALSLKLGL